MHAWHFNHQSHAVVRQRCLYSMFQQHVRYPEMDFMAGSTYDFTSRVTTAFQECEQRSIHGMPTLYFEILHRENVRWLRNRLTQVQAEMYPPNSSSSMTDAQHGELHDLLKMYREFSPVQVQTAINIKQNYRRGPRRPVQLRLKTTYRVAPRDPTVRNDHRVLRPSRRARSPHADHYARCARHMPNYIGRF